MSLYSLAVAKTVQRQHKQPVGGPNLGLIRLNFYHIA